MNWFKKSQSIQNTLPYFEEFEQYGDYIPQEDKLNEYLKNKHNTEIIRDIGQGDSGVAYLLSNGDVLKITTNSQEGEVATFLMNNKNPYIATYKDVWKEGDLYYIILEHLDQMISENAFYYKIFTYIRNLLHKNNCYNVKCAYNIIKSEPYISLDLKKQILEYLEYLSNVPIKLFDFLNYNNIGIKDGKLKFFDIT